MGRSNGDLIKECQSRGIKLPESKLHSKDMIKLLSQDSIEKRGGWNNLSWGMQQRLQLDDLMLCYPYKHMKPEQQNDCMTSDEWIAERKLNGCRMLITYHQQEGFGFFSRNISVKDFLPVDYTEKILLRYQGELLEAGDLKFKELFDQAFVLDAEALCDEAHIDTKRYTPGGKGGTITGKKLNAVITILAIEKEISHRIQREQAQLNLVVFDCVMYGLEELRHTSLKKRMFYRKHSLRMLSDQGILMKLVDSNIDWGVSKQDFYDQVLLGGDEGIVLKNLKSEYDMTGHRTRTGFVKRKRSVKEVRGADIDAFVTGFVPSNPKNAWAHLIGGLEMSVILVDKDGNERQKCIAVVAAMTMEMRKSLTTYDEGGRPQLNPEALGRVLVVNGQDCSAKAERFMHAVADWDRGFRDDKTYVDCRMDESFLNSQIL